MTAVELEPCPFCGADAELTHDSDHHGEWFNLGCSQHWHRVADPDKVCPAAFMWYTEDLTNEATAIAAWNRRSCYAEAREVIEFIAEEADRGRHDGRPEPGPAHDAAIMWWVAREWTSKHGPFVERRSETGKELHPDEPMACCGLKPSEGHNGCCTFYGEDVRAIMAACSRRPHPDDPKAGRAAVDLIREIERVVERARDRPAPKPEPSP